MVQAGGRLFDTPGTLALLHRFAHEAADSKAELIVFPEAFVGGYPKGMTFGAQVGIRSAAGRDAYVRYAGGAITLPGPELAAMCELAAQVRSDLVVGVIERDGGTLYCATVFIGADGRYLGKHRKLMSTGSERLIWGHGDGSTMQVHRGTVGTMGAAICWENYMPAYRQHLYAQGIQIWCAPTVDERDIWEATVRHIAYEGRCFVLSACQYLDWDHVPADYAELSSAPRDAPLIRGGSVIVSPLGEVLAGPVRGCEQVLVATLAMADITRGKFDLDVAGHYARPDIFELRVDLGERSPVRPGRRAEPAAAAAHDDAHSPDRANQRISEQVAPSVSLGDSPKVSR